MAAVKVYFLSRGNWHELDRAVIFLIGIAAFELCEICLLIHQYCHLCFKKKEGRKEKVKRNDRSC